MDRPLAELQQEAMQAIGISLTEVDSLAQTPSAEDRLIVEDRLLFSSELIREFVSLSRPFREATVCCLRKGLSTLRTISSTQGVDTGEDHLEYGIWFLPAGCDVGILRTVVLDPDRDGLAERLPIPVHLTGGEPYFLPMTDMILIRIDHWTNLWMANIVMLMYRGAKLKKAPMWHLAWLAMRSRSINRWRIFAKTSRIGERCDIHPTAYVEGSTIGAGVTIGAGSVVRASDVGPGSYIANNSSVELSVIGSGSSVMNGSSVQMSVLGSGCVNNTWLGASLCGRNSFLGAGAVLGDVKLDGAFVSVMKDGARVDTGNRFVGGCLGHESHLGAGVMMAPGRMVPNGRRLVLDASRVVGKADSDQIPGYRIL